MRYPLDLVYLNASGQVLKCVNGLRPFRFSAARGARHTLELPKGSIRLLGIRVGETLAWAEQETVQASQEKIA
jgi:uncharacterized membrane protein (UPF0127 family)